MASSGRAAFTIHVKEYLGCVEVTLRGDRTGITMRKTCSHSMPVVLITVARMWMAGAKMLANGAPSGRDGLRSHPKDSHDRT